MAVTAALYELLRIPVNRLVPKYMRPALTRLYMRTFADAIVISFPKCGRTWLRIMLGEYFRLHFSLPEIELLELHRLSWKYPQVPEVWFSHDDDPQLKFPEQLSSRKDLYRSSRIVFLARDPRDVVVSLFFHKSYRSNTFEGTLHDYVRQRCGSIETAVKFFNLWISQQHIPDDFHLMRYEDMHANPKGEMRRLLNFLGISEPSQVYIDKAIEFGRFENMKNMEVNGVIDNDRIRTPPGSHHHAFKTREGIIGGYRKHLGEKDVQYLDYYVNNHLDYRYGYCRSENNEHIQI